MNLVPFTVLVCLLASILFASCDILKKDVDDESGGLSQAEVSQFFLENQDAPFAMFDAFSRVLQVINGSPVNGVTLTPRKAGKSTVIYDGVIGLDFDFDSIYEVNVIGYIEFPGTAPNLDNGATLYITEVTGSPVDGTATASVTAAGPGGAFLEGVASFGVSNDDPVELDFSATVSYFQSSISGFSEVVYGDWTADVYFEPSQFAPYQVRVVTPDEEYVIGANLF